MQQSSFPELSSNQYGGNYGAAYDPNSLKPHKVSRSKIDLFLECARCFYFDVRLNVKRPRGYPFTLNSAVDTLLKSEFDTYRAKGNAHPLMKSYKIDAIPFAHKDLDTWRYNFTGVQYVHKPTNLLVFGAVDDVWQSPNGELIVVDYKATAKAGEVNLDADWQIGYKRQMEVYQWLLRHNGFEVSRVGYFVYANGIKDKQAFDAQLEFKLKIIPYEGNDGWIEGTLADIHKCLNQAKPPLPSKACEYCGYIHQRQEAKSNLSS